MGNGDGGAFEVQRFVIKPGGECGFEVFVFGRDGHGEVDAVEFYGIESGVVNGG